MTDLFDWTPPPKYPNAPGFKTGGTSRDAARKMAPRARTLRDQVWATLRNVYPTGLTADEVATRIGRSVLSVRPRLSELAAAGKITPLIRPDGKTERRTNESGLDANVCVCVLESE